MLILAIETATAQVGCALGNHQGVLASFHCRPSSHPAGTAGNAAPRQRHAEILVPAIEFSCAQAGVELSEVGAVAVDVGPGLFTGLRVGVATAKALAQALRVPTLGVSSLDLLAFPVRHSRRLIVAVVDARRGELFYAFYRHAPGGAQRLSDYQLGTPADVTSELEARGEETLIVGDGTLRYPELGDDSRCDLGGEGLAHPSAAALVELAHPRAVREEFSPSWELEPLYLRQADAAVNWERRTAGKAG